MSGGSRFQSLTVLGKMMKEAITWQKQKKTEKKEAKKLIT
jgi:hypothetical protein